MRYDTLLGSRVQPAVFKMTDGSFMQLGELVRRAFDGSGLTVDQWNSLPDKAREENLETELCSLVTSGKISEREVPTLKMRPA